MNLGISTYCAAEWPLDIALSWISDRVGSAEILSDNYHDLFQYAEICHSYSLRYTVHAPTADINIASMIEPIRKTSIDVIRNLLHICDDLDSQFLVIHPGFNAWGRPGVRTMQSLERSFQELSQMQREHDTRIVVENMPPYDMYPFQEPAFCDVLDTHDLGFILDIGHAHMTGNLPEFLDKKPIYMHIHDNGGASDDHLAYGDGTISLNILEWIRKIPCTIEVKTREDAEKSLDRVIAHM